MSINPTSILIPFTKYAYMTVSLPLGALFFCFITAVIFQYDEVNETVCNVQNFVPSISAITGVFPQAFVWRLCIALHSTPRLVACWMYYNLFMHRLCNISVHYRVYFKGLAHLNFWLNLIENLCLASVSFISNKENYPVHEKIFVVFMVSSLLYMILNTSLFRWSSPQPRCQSDEKSYKGKMLFTGIALASTAALLYCFYLHRVLCVPLAFSFFSIAEYVIAIASMSYHMTAIYEFRHRTACVVASHDEHSNGSVPGAHTHKSE